LALFKLKRPRLEKVMQSTQKITPCLWFDHEAEEAAEFYVGIFRNLRILHVSRYPDEGQEIHGKEAGTVLIVSFELEGNRFTALNGGPMFKFNEAISFQIDCNNQEEVDYSGRSCPRGAMKQRSNAAGSRINTVFHGRLYP
jgi:predicted 3-demethylubiquinone-9 3-methyltransferase (glyoxalase superfamily)